VLITPDAVYLEDMGSVNGTFVNGEAIDKQRLLAGDTIDIAGHVFNVQLQRPEP
jgi:pSer/pThr/pTyr-binding forkhead associated (FHA) protein